MTVMSAVRALGRRLTPWGASLGCFKTVVFIRGRCSTLLPGNTKALLHNAIAYQAADITDSEGFRHAIILAHFLAVVYSLYRGSHHTAGTQ